MLLMSEHDNYTNPQLMKRFQLKQEIITEKLFTFFIN